MRMYVRFLLCWLMMGLAMQLQAQRVAFVASASSRQVMQGEEFDITFTLTGAEDMQFSPPSVNDFRVVGGPNRSSQVQIINGNVSRQKAWSYVLMARNPGRFTIGAASVRLNNGSTLTSQPLDIEVTTGSAPGQRRQQGGANPQPLSGDDEEVVRKIRSQVSLKAIPSSTQAHVGEQVTIDFKVFTTIGIDELSISRMPDFTGMIVRDLEKFDGEIKDEIIGGRRYKTKVLKRISLFPVQAGTITIEPMMIRAAVERRSNGVFGFFDAELIPCKIESAPFTINVNPLPANAPASFTGGVGQYDVSWSADKTQLTTDDAITLSLTIEGDGDIQGIKAPKLNLSADSFEVYDPQITENQYEQNGKLGGWRKIEYIVLPKFAGQYDLRPSFAWFDPAQDKYVLADSGLIHIEVKPGSPNRDLAREGDFRRKDILAIRQGTLRNDAAHDGWMPVAALLGLFGFAGAVLFAFWKRSRRESAPTEENIVIAPSPRFGSAGVKKTSAAKATPLTQLSTLMKEGHQQAIGQEVLKLVREHVSTRHSVPLTMVSGAMIERLVMEGKMDAETGKALAWIYQESEMAAYGGVAVDIEALYRKVQSTLS